MWGKFENAAFLKFSQVMPISSIDMGIAYQIGAAGTMLYTNFHFTLSFHV